MENLTLEQAEQLVKDDKRNRVDSYARITGLAKNQIRIIEDDFIVFEAKSMQDIKECLTSIKPYSNSITIQHGDDRYDLVSHYRIECVNDFHNRKLKIEFTGMAGKFWIKININDLPEEFVSKFLHPFRRPLYDTESHYVNIPPNYKKFKNIRIDAYSFNSNYKNLSWHGGNRTLIDELAIKEIVEYIIK